MFKFVISEFIIFDEQLQLPAEIHNYRRSKYSFLPLGVGKSCVLMQFLEGKFKYDSETTIGVEFGSKLVELENRKLKMQIWDTVLLFATSVRQDKKSSNPSLDPIIAAPSAPYSCTI